MTLSLKPTPDVTIDASIIKEHGFNDEEYQTLLQIMGRTPNLTELGIFSVMWSEHCSYKSTRLHLKTLPTTAPWVICGPGENAGVIDIEDGDAAIFKMESHNHPSFIEPYQGAATGVGGILRDIFTMGARPIANMNALRFGSLDHPKTKHLLSGVVAGIGGYGNCIGVPTVGGECNFHPSYNGNILVNAMNVGIAKSNNIFYCAASDVGSPILYAGSKTGRDGIHGATMASAEFDDDSEEKRPTVQVGDPFTEKKLLEACLELMATDAILSIQDMGAAGLTCSSLEMASKGGTGVELQLDTIPVREEGMTPYEIMLSESQERMLMVIKPGKEQVALDIFAKWEIDSAIIGHITDTGNMVLKLEDEIVAELPIDPLSEEAPIYDRPHQMQVDDRAITLDEEHENNPDAILTHLQTLLATPDLASKRWIWEQYDHQVMNDTLVGPGSDAAIVRVHGTQKALAIATDCTPRYCLANPVEGGKQAVAETYRNISASGATPLAITNCLNFGNPEKPDIMGQLVGCLEGMKEACNVLDYPVISGNVSLYNETNGNAIQPTPAIGGVGLLKDYTHAIPNHFTAENMDILLLGDTHGHLGSSLFARDILNKDYGSAPTVDLPLERKHADFIRTLHGDSLIASCHDISDGGLLVAIFEMTTKHHIGATLQCPTALPLTAYCFGEDQARYIICCDSNHSTTILEKAQQDSLAIALIGTTGGTSITLNNSQSIAIATLMQIHESVLLNFIQR